jgi:hypothetical protein
MTSQLQEIGSGKNLAARPLQVEFAVVLSRVIESMEDDPAPLLRNAVYELARIKLRREAWQKNPAINLSEVRCLMLALESAIEGVETIYSKHDELRALQSLDRLIESSEIGRSKVMIEPREPLLVINQAPTQTADADHPRVFSACAKGASLNVKRLLQPGAAPLLRGALVAFFALALCAVVSQFGSLARQAPLSLPSQAESAPTTSAAAARTHATPTAHSRHPRFVAAGSSEGAWDVAPRERGDHDPSTAVVRRDEQPVRPPRSSCSTQTYKVPSEGGGEASINMVRCYGQ